MKTTIVLAITCALFTAMSVSAQSRSTKSTTRSDSRTTFGIRAGFNLQNINGKNVNGDEISTNDMLFGFNGGVNAEIPVGIDFYLQPGLIYSAKGNKYDIGNVEFKRRIHYLELPVNFIYKPDLGEGKLLLGFGPYAAIALGGHIEGGSTKTDMQFGDNVGEVKAFDAGANMLAGYEFSSRVSFQLNAQLGLVNMYNRPANDSRTSWKNTGFGLSLGYRLN